MLTTTKKQQLQIEGNEALKSGRESKMSIRMDREEAEEDADSRMRKMLLRNKHLVSIEVDEEELKQKEKNGKKKNGIVSYTANRDTLFIPHPERTKRPVDIKSNLIEEEKKKPIADIGIQSDDINYENPEKPFIPQKIGKDVGVQIEDGDLFNFDRDVQPLLTVLCGKILEQSELELCQEAEMRNLKDTKNAFLRKLKIYKDEVRKLEEEEIARKKENENLKKMKKIELLSKIDTQQRLTSRVFAKGYLKNFYANTLSDLKTRKAFLDYSSIIVKDKLNDYSVKQAELTLDEHTTVENSVKSVLQEGDKNKISLHSETIQKRREMIQKKKEEAEKKRIEDEERRRIEEEQRQERRRLRAIRKLRLSILKNVFELGAVKGQYYAEEISEIDNYELDSPFVGIYGGLIGSFVISLSIIKNQFFQQDQYYTQDMIIEILTNYLNDCESFTIYFDSKIEDTLKQLLNDEQLDINNLKGNTNISTEEWVKIGEILSDLKLNYDYMFKHLVTGDSQSQNSFVDISFYSTIIKSLCQMVERGICINKINFVFKSPPETTNTKGFEENVRKYQAFCKLELPDSCENILENADYLRDHKKKPVKVPELEEDLKIARYFQRTPDHNILIYDKNAEFIIRNKILESSIRAIHNDVETKQIFKTFNEVYEQVVSTTLIESTIQTFSYKASEFQPA